MLLSSVISDCVLQSNNVKTRLVQLVISLSGIKVSDVTGQVRTLFSAALSITCTYISQYYCDLFMPNAVHKKFDFLNM